MFLKSFFLKFFDYKKSNVRVSPLDPNKNIPSKKYNLEKPTTPCYNSE